ncbi:hypothetical protein [Paludisphaera sp.]|uniref:hypothetical protein n=1 Tax=Paludisphaera sp. TaxID=2017432 RepID=UPI00301BF1B7
MNGRPRFEFVRLLALAAEAGLMRWDPQGAADDVCTCRSACDGQRYRLRHIWWYAADGIPLDRQAVVIASEAVEVGSTWGTIGHDHALRFLATSSREWREHVREMIDRVSPPEPSMAEPPDISTKWQSLALAVRDASTRGRLYWERSPASTGREQYVGHMTETDQPFGSIEVLRPVGQDDKTFGVMAARLSTSWGQAIFAAGTEGMELLREALAASLPDWGVVLERENEALDAECRKLRDLLG